MVLGHLQEAIHIHEGMGEEERGEKAGRMLLLIVFTPHRRNKGKSINLSRSLRPSLGSENNSV